jgi:hypothetical protein
MSDAFTRAVQRGDKRLFEDVTVVNQRAQQDATGDPTRDSHGNIVWRAPDTTAVAAEIVYRGSPQFSARADSVDTDIDAMVFVPADAAYGSGVYGRGVYGRYVSDGGAEDIRATRIEDDGDRYVVRDTFHEDNGRIRCHCRKED